MVPRFLLAVFRVIQQQQGRIEGFIRGLSLNYYGTLLKCGGRTGANVRLIQRLGLRASGFSWPVPS